MVKNLFKILQMSLFMKLSHSVFDSFWRHALKQTLLLRYWFSPPMFLKSFIVPYIQIPADINFRCALDDFQPRMKLTWHGEKEIFKNI